MFRIWTGLGKATAYHHIDFDERNGIPDSVWLWAKQGKVSEGTKPLLALPNGHNVPVIDILNWCKENEITVDGHGIRTYVPTTHYFVQKGGVDLFKVECQSTLDAYMLAWVRLENQRSLAEAVGKYISEEKENDLSE